MSRWFLLRSLSRRMAVLVLLVLAPAGPADAAAGPVRQDRFLVGGYCISDSHENPGWLVAIDSAGFDFVDNLDQHFDSMYGRLLIRQLDSLRLARPGFRLQAVVNLTRSDARHEAFSGVADASEPVLKRIARTFRPFGGYSGPSVLGWSMGDEPCTREQVGRNATIARFLRADSLTWGVFPLSNLLPLPGPGVPSCLDEDFPPGTDRRAAYAAYCDEWLARFDDGPEPAPVLSFDHYPFHWRGRAPSDFPENLAIASDRARARGRATARVPLWVVIQLSRFRAKNAPYSDTPTLAHTRWQAWYSIAYGAKGIAYWTLYPSGRQEGPRYDFGLWAQGGGPDRARVEAIRKLNAQLHAVGPALMPLDPVEVWRGRKNAPGSLVVDVDWGAAGFSRPVVAATEGAGHVEDLVIGQLRHARSGDDYLLVMNASLTRSRSFRLTLAARADTVERIDRSSGRAVRVGTAPAALEVRDLGPAEAELYRVVDRLIEPIPGVLEIREDGPQRYFRTAQGILRVDRETGARTRVTALAGRAAAGLRATSAGVVAAD